MSDFEKLLAIRAAYAHQLPIWMRDYERTGRMHQNPYFMDWQFSPIEACVWSDIRGVGVPFYPQIPVLKYFIDFGCPFLKIGIECDGKAWHDSDRDAVRDRHLAAEGWMIFRIEGHECKRTIDAFPDTDEPDPQLVYEFFMTTSEGIVTALKQRYFEPRPGYQWQREVELTLFNHRSTPEMSPEPRRIQMPRTPQLLRHSVSDFINVLADRMLRSPP